ncbi:MAG: isopeptide-forming domain-containing fimbrial protein [Lachnospiraceae bacterium]|nr:isopeptide-forming domain-containing fimbrial protein [Lachnospiraceae bacterium]
MKQIKKIASIILAAVMVMAMTIPAFAADNNSYTITVDLNKNDKGIHTYEAYQLFKGDLKIESDGKKVLSNIEWGNNVTDVSALLQALKSNDKLKKDGTNLFEKCSTASDVAEVVAKFSNTDSNNSGMLDDFADVVETYLGKKAAGTTTTTTTDETATINVIGAGYYLVKDKDESLTANDTAYTRFLLQVVGNANVVVKSEVPSGDKKVYVVDATGTTHQAGDANYATIGSHVSYEITSKVPNYTDYDYYYFIMNDTLSNGLTFDGAESVEVKVGEGDTQTTLTQGTDYYVYTENVGGNTFRLAFANIMNYQIGSKIVVTYSATVNNQALTGNTGNPNTWNLTYSNKPDETYTGKSENGRPGLPNEEETNVFGKTPDEKTLTYLTKLDITKYANEVDLEDLEKNLLAGAEFTLTGTSYQVILKAVEYYEASDKGTYYLLKDGTYTETAPTGTDYVEIGVGTATTTKGYIKDENGDYVVPENVSDYDGATLYKLVKGTAEDYLDVNTKYEKKTKDETTLVPVNVSMEMTTGADGKIAFERLGAGTYTLTETVTPEGFNTIEPIEFTISFVAPDKVTDGTEKCTWSIDWKDATNNEGIFAANVINKSGSTLPSTGGIGTTIFYIIGGILVVGAAILLITKKRMSSEA